MSTQCFHACWHVHLIHIFHAQSAWLKTSSKPRSRKRECRRSRLTQVLYISFQGSLKGEATSPPPIASLQQLPALFQRFPSSVPPPHTPPFHLPANFQAFETLSVIATPSPLYRIRSKIEICQDPKNLRKKYSCRIWFHTTHNTTNYSWYLGQPPPNNPVLVEADLAILIPRPSKHVSLAKRYGAKIPRLPNQHSKRKHSLLIHLRQQHHLDLVKSTNLAKHYLVIYLCIRIYTYTSISIYLCMCLCVHFFMIFKI